MVSIILRLTTKNTTVRTLFQEENCMTYHNQPNPDDRSDNVEKLQKMIHNTIENMHEAEESMKTASEEQRLQIKEKNQRRLESIAAMREEIKDEYHDQH